MYAKHEGAFPKVIYEGKTYKDEHELYRLIAPRGDVAAKVAFINSLQLSTLAKNRTFQMAIFWGHLPTVQAFTQMPDLDPTENHCFSIQWAVKKGSLEILQLLLSLPNISPCISDHLALREAVTSKCQLIINYLINLPCYNILDPELSAEQRIEIKELFAELGLTAHIDARRTRANLKFMFFGNTESILDNLPNDLKHDIAHTAIELNEASLLTLGNG